MRSHARRAFVLVCLATSTGCHIYNTGNDKLAQQVQKDFRDLNLAKSLDEEKKLSAAMLQAEVESASKQQDAVRDQQLSILLDMPLAQNHEEPCAFEPAPVSGAAADVVNTATFLCDIDRRLTDVVGSAGLPPTADYSAQLKQAMTVAESLKSAQGFPTDDITFDCTVENAKKLAELNPTTDKRFEKMSPKARDHLAAFLGSYAGEGGHCPSWLAAQSASAPKGELGKAIAALETAKKALASASESTKAAKAEYEAASKKYDDATTVTGRVEKTAKEIADKEAALEASLDKLDKDAETAAASLRNSGVFSNPAKIEALEARQKELTKTIRKVLTQIDDAYTRTGMQAVIGAAVELEHIDRDESLPVLLLRAEQVRGELAHAKAEQALTEKEIAALADKVAAYQRAWSELWVARLTLRGGLSWTPVTSPAKPAKAPADDRCSNLTSTVGESMTSSRCGRAVAGAMLHYANAWTLGFGPARIADIRYIGAIDDGKLEVSSAALETWEHVLAVPIDQIVKFHSGGTKPEEVAKVIVGAVGFAGLIATTGAQAAK